MIKRNIKMKVTPEESKQVQEICFANGIGWNGGIFGIIGLNKNLVKVYQSKALIEYIQ